MGKVVVNFHYSLNCDNTNMAYCHWHCEICLEICLTSSVIWQKL